MGLNDWMTGVNSSTLLSDISIPGTHDSCARYDHATAGYTQTQWLSIPDQLSQGIRYLDIRCTYELDGKPFEITHGGYDQKITFAEVQAQVIEFLDANPSEVVLMNVQQEYSKASNTEFVARFDSIIAGHEDHWFFEERIPMLGEVRKRIVLIRTFDPLTFDGPKGDGGWLTNKGIPWNGFKYWDGDGLSENDYFTTQNASNAWESDKKAAIEKKFGVTVAERRGRFVLNFLSYAHGGATPGKNAEAMNPWVDDYIEKQLAPDALLGMLPMDFASNTPGFIQEIVNRNPTYTNTKGDLVWREHSGWQTGAPFPGGPGFPPMGVTIGKGGWTGFKLVFATTDGVIYAIDWYGNLNRYRDTRWQQGGAPLSLSPGQMIGEGGWDKFKFVFATSKGVIYAIDSYGNLNRYRDTDWQKGNGLVGNGQVISEGGWNLYRAVFATSDGVIYAIDSQGDLWWYQDTDWQNGNGLVGARQKVGDRTFDSGTKSVFATSDGVIYTISWSGTLWWRQHADWRSGNGQVGSPLMVGAEGWTAFKTVFATSQGRIYSTTD